MKKFLDDRKINYLFEDNEAVKRNRQIWTKFQKNQNFDKFRKLNEKERKLGEKKYVIIKYQQRNDILH